MSWWECPKSMDDLRDSNYLLELRRVVADLCEGEGDNRYNISEWQEEGDSDSVMREINVMLEAREEAVKRIAELSLQYIARCQWE